WLAFHFSSHVRLLLLTGFGHGHALLRWRLASLPLHSSATQKPFFTSLNSQSDLTQVFVSCLLARIRLAGTEQSCPGLSGSTLALVLRPLSGCADRLNRRQRVLCCNIPKRLQAPTSPGHLTIGGHSRGDWAAKAVRWVFPTALIRRKIDCMTTRPIMTRLTRLAY